MVDLASKRQPVILAVHIDFYYGKCYGHSEIDIKSILIFICSLNELVFKLMTLLFNLFCIILLLFKKLTVCI
jgi:hypothetical protein